MSSGREEAALLDLGADAKTSSSDPSSSLSGMSIAGGRGGDSPIVLANSFIASLDPGPVSVTVASSSPSPASPSPLSPSSTCLSFSLPRDAAPKKRERCRTSSRGGGSGEGSRPARVGFFRRRGSAASSACSRAFNGTALEGPARGEGAGEISRSGERGPGVGERRGGGGEARRGAAGAGAGARAGAGGGWRGGACKGSGSGCAGGGASAGASSLWGWIKKSIHGCGRVEGS
ncbi:hypothetical protein GSI_02311 [Ganoderma sinense ZZ0214-1]|uniref:Uncharacterized protein n=1 Tax=Ganoderma sinense ZZ0214-1 TaxID=1077348 RepID=A0A2G8SPE0_9APHY|nr:hypothetical protein GSI_02311 [Ganoderma sinense ZZ0214-1]